ncbi:hypothetical protein BV22DRAFT_1128532 [Leucogyrophana mollusca]|uniref:Uncharacterized protein n=1 Tax=Leucogyrophana mollusca TaxID=85980 RepID=A0ACB8BLB4_9AGAM|nr:hypothetical protein BV22DRAFT_1128532 [Leucogyrophana mollusca]
MHVKSVKEIVKDVKRRLSHHGKHKHTDSATTDDASSSSDSVLPSSSSTHHFPSHSPSPSHDDSYVAHRIIVPGSPRSRKSSATYESRPRKLRKSFSSYSKASSKYAASADTHNSDMSTTASGTLVTAESGMSPHKRTISIDRSSSVAPASGSEAGGDDRSTYASARQSMTPGASQEGASEITRQPSELQPLPEDSGEGLSVASPPPQIVEPEVPDPFIVDDSEGGVSEEDGAASQVEEIKLAQSASLSPTTTTSSAPPNVNKDVPPPPPESDEEETHDLYLPGLTMPTMFLPIPNTDPLTSLLIKYITPPEQRPVRDVTGEWQHTDFHSMVMSNSWRALARMARDRLVTSNPENLSRILDLWYLRLSSLARLRLYNQTSAECTNLFAVLNAIEPVSARAWLFDRLLPFELEVMHTRLKCWAADHMGYIDALYALLGKCKSKARAAKAAADNEALSMWLERAARVCLIIASQLVEMKDFAGAAKLLEPLCTQSDGVTSPAIRSAVGRIHLQSGYLAMASKHFDIVAADPSAPQELKNMNAALLASAEGDWAVAGESLKTLLEAEPDNYVALNNLSVALLSQGKLKESIEVLETALNTSPATVVVAEPYLFNLSTLYELRSTTAQDKKRDLLIQVARWSGDGLKTACLKMPSN